jgi:hypothetical protein
MKPRTVAIAIAGVAVGFTIGNAAMLDLVRKRYAGYLTSRRPQVVFSCRFTRIGRFPASAKAAVARQGRSAWCARRRDFDCRWNASSGTLRLPPSIYSFDACLRVLLATLLPSHGCILVHAAAVGSGGKAYAFPGKSGSGKTTISRLSRNGIILNDEISALSMSRRQAFVWGTPFWGEMGSGPPHNRPHALHALYFLQKSRANRITPLTTTEALRRLLRCICTFSADSDHIGDILAIAGRLVDATRTGVLAFQKSTAIWEYLDAAGSDAEQSP